MLAVELVADAAVAIVEDAPPILATPLELTSPLDNAPAGTLVLPVGAVSPDEELAAEITRSSTSKV